MATTPIRIFVCGIKGHIPKSNQAPNLIFSDIRKLRKEGLDVTVHQVDPKTPRDRSVEEFQGLIAGKEFDGVSIGFGIRGDQELTPLFEDLVNTVLAELQPPPRMIFTENIDRLYVSVRRAFPTHAS